MSTTLLICMTRYGLADVLGDINNITYRVNDIAESEPFSIGQVIYPEN